MDKTNRNGVVKIINHFMSNKSKDLKNNVPYLKSKKNINEIDNKLLSPCNYGKTINEIGFNSSSHKTQNNNDILRNNLQSPISNNTVKSILKNKINSDSSPNIKKEKNIKKKNNLNVMLYKSICQNSNEISDYSFSSLFKKENESQDLISPINIKKLKSKKFLFLQKMTIQ